MIQRELIALGGAVKRPDEVADAARRSGRATRGWRAACWCDPVVIQCDAAVAERCAVGQLPPSPTPVRVVPIEGVGGRAWGVLEGHRLCDAAHLPLAGHLRPAGGYTWRLTLQREQPAGDDPSHGPGGAVQGPRGIGHPVFGGARADGAANSESPRGAAQLDGLCCSSQRRHQRRGSLGALRYENRALQQQHPVARGTHREAHRAVGEALLQCVRGEDCAVCRQCRRGASPCSGRCCRTCRY